jgi:hypothetical protein
MSSLDLQNIFSKNDVEKRMVGYGFEHKFHDFKHFEV